MRHILVPVFALASVSHAQDLPGAVARAAELIVSMQESDRWPYEGVYRVDGKIPVGYEVGGTSICAAALLRAPGFTADGDRRAAVERAIDFVTSAINHPLMSEKDYDAGYDVRGWGYTYGLDFLLEVKRLGLMAPAGEPPAKDATALRVDGAAVERAIAFYLNAIHKTEIPQAGGWNYARPPGRDKVAPPSPFMTAPTLQALFAARAQGCLVDDGVVNRALAALEAARTPAGGIVYSGDGARARDAVPGAVGRMVAAEGTLLLAGRSSVANVRAAVDAFIVHWEWLNKRRAQPGTHVAPYAIAPYYFYYAHYYAAQAVEMLPEMERAEYRRRINDLLFSVRQQDGSWNDRVFPRTANYGTSMAAMAILMPQTAPPARWAP